MTSHLFVAIMNDFVRENKLLTRYFSYQLGGTVEAPGLGFADQMKHHRLSGRVSVALH